MPERDGFGPARFRRGRHEGPRRDALGFWDVFAAVLLALCVFSVVQGLLVWYVVSKELDRMQREIAGFVASMEKSASPQLRLQSPPPVRRPHAQRLPGYPGPVTARANAAPYACAGGRTVRRLADGWEDTGGRCRATSQ